MFLYKIEEVPTISWISICFTLKICLASLNIISSNEFGDVLFKFELLLQGEGEKCTSICTKIN